VFKFGAFVVSKLVLQACGVTTNGQTCFVNASTCTLQYRPTNPAFVFDIPLPSDE